MDEALKKQGTIVRLDNIIDNVRRNKIRSANIFNMTVIVLIAVFAP